MEKQPVNIEENSHSCKQVEIRDEKGRFIKGVSGNPDGGPKGIKQRLTMFKEDLMQVYEEIGGAEALRNWVLSNSNNKKFFFQFILGLLPREIESKVEVNEVTGKTKEEVCAILTRKLEYLGFSDNTGSK